MRKGSELSGKEGGMPTYESHDHANTQPTWWMRSTRDSRPRDVRETKKMRRVGKKTGRAEDLFAEKRCTGTRESMRMPSGTWPHNPERKTSGRQRIERHLVATSRMPMCEDQQHPQRKLAAPHHKRPRRHHKART